jgi:hypothetical protein
MYVYSQESGVVYGFIKVHCTFYQYFSVLHQKTLVADVVASVTLNYQLIRNSLEFENLFFFFIYKN